MTINEKIAVLNVYKDVNARILRCMKSAEAELLECSEKLKQEPDDIYYKRRESDLIDELYALGYVFDQITELALSE